VSNARAAATDSGMGGRRRNGVEAGLIQVSRGALLYRFGGGVRVGGVHFHLARLLHEARTELELPGLVARGGTSQSFTRLR
jgi:hypothetical protein